jgi:ribonuclease P protein component
MNRRFRLTNSSDFQRVRRTGSSHAHPLAILLVCPGTEEESRFGFTAGRALGGAVARNRAKRLMREAIRHYLPSIKPGWDAVIIARPDLLEATWDEVLAGIGQLLKRSGISNA